MTVRPESLLELVHLIPRDVVRVAESGIRDGAHMAQLRAVGYDAFLVGEALMRQPDPGAALAKMLDEASRQPAAVGVGSARPVERELAHATYGRQRCARRQAGRPPGSPHVHRTLSPVSR